MDTNARAEELTGFLRNLFGDRKVSLARATITDRGKTTQTFHEGSGRLKPWSMSIDMHARSMIKKADQGTEIFYAPTPMSGNAGRKKEQALPNIVVFGDADEGLTADAKAKLIELGACLVRSGGKLPSGAPKYHVYLLLTKEVEPNELERLNRGLKAFIRGDKFDSTTLLRLPGTRNHKYPGAPLVRVERLADARHTPENLIKFLGVVHAAESPTATKLVLPTVPKDFNWRDNKPGYARMRKVMREWDQRFDDPHQEPRRYMAAIAIVKDALKYGVDIDTAYAFAERCKPLQDKAEEENGYSIQKDIAKIWRREAGMKPSGTLTADDIVSAPQNQDAKDKTRTTPPTVSQVAGTAFAPVDLGPDFPFALPNLDELLAGEYKPLEPTMVPCGTFHLLYPGKSHSLVADRSMGKTHIAIAMVHAIMRNGGRVVYFDFEDTPDTFIRDRMMNQHGITEAMIRNQFLYIGGIDDELRPEDMKGVVRDLASKIKGWDLVVIDGVSASMGDLDDESDGNKDVDYKKWHKIMVQPFLDEEIATLQLDHSTKSSARAGGTMQKGAKLTGVEYQVRVEGPHGFTIGRTGRVIIEAPKDRVGRIAKYRRKNPPSGHAGKDEWPWNDVATFTLSSDDEGRITQAEFEPINYSDTAKAVEEKVQPLSDKEQRVIDSLIEMGKPATKSALIKKAQLRTPDGYAAITRLESRGMVEVTKEGNSHFVTLLASAPKSSGSHADTGTTLDFSKADKMPRGAVRKLECHNCGDQYEYPKEFVQADEEGYIHTKRTCRACAGENISREPEDGAEWARKVRGRITRRKTQRGDS